MALPAWKIAADVADGYLTLNVVMLKKFSPGEITAVAAEIDRAMREARSQVIPVDDQDATQKRNRRLLRLSQAATILQTSRSRR